MASPGGSPGWNGVYNSAASTPTRAQQRSPGSPRDFIPAHRRVASPTNGLYFSPTAPKTVSVLSRPIKASMNPHNAENLDVQYQKDMAAQERHANTFRRLASEKWHHNGPANPSLLEQGHIVDRGRAKTITQAAHGVYDPILSEFKIPPQASPASNRPTSAPPGARSVSTPPRADKVIQETWGVRNPITGAVKPGAAPSPSYEATKQLLFERNHGGRGILFRSDRDVSYNPITGEVQALPPAAARTAPPRPLSAPRSSYHTTPQALGDRPSTPSRRQILSGPSWGQYNPVNHEWQVPPHQAKYQEPSAQVERTHYLTGTHARKVALPPNQGVYNPILNQWTVPPANPRIAAGLSFAPATMFSRASPSTIRSPR